MKAILTKEKLDKMTTPELKQAMADHNMNVFPADTRASMIRDILGAIEDEKMVTKMLNE